MLQSREFTSTENEQIVFYFLCIYSHTPSPRTFLFDVVCNGVTVLVSRIWSKSNSYPYVFRTFWNSVSALAQKKRHKWTKGLQRKSSVSGLYRRKYLHLSPTLILFGDLRRTDRCIDISTVRWENSMRAKSCNIWTHSGSLQPLIIVTERWRKYPVAFTLRQHPHSAERHALFSRDLYYFHSLCHSFIVPSFLYDLYPLSHSVYILFFFPILISILFFFIFLFSSLFLPFVFTFSLVVISFGLLRHNIFLNIATHVPPLI